MQLPPHSSAIFGQPRTGDALSQHEPACDASGNVEKGLKFCESVYARARTPMKRPRAEEAWEVLERLGVDFARLRTVPIPEEDYDYPELLSATHGRRGRLLGTPARVELLSVAHLVTGDVAHLEAFVRAATPPAGVHTPDRRSATHKEALVRAVWARVEAFDALHVLVHTCAVLDGSEASSWAILSPTRRAAVREHVRARLHAAQLDQHAAVAALLASTWAHVPAVLQAINTNARVLMCPRCHAGPILHEGCGDTAAHHGERCRRTNSRIDNRCPNTRCRYFASATVRDGWREWDGYVRAHEGTLFPTLDCTSAAECAFEPVLGTVPPVRPCWPHRAAGERCVAAADSWEGVRAALLAPRASAAAALDLAGATDVPDGAHAGARSDALRNAHALVRVGEDAFAGCGLQRFDAPATLREIGERAFRDNRLRELRLPRTLEWVGAHAFEKNELRTLHIEDARTHVGAFAFAHNALETLVLPPGSRRVPTGAFMANRLATLRLPAELAEIGSSAFAQNALTRVALPPALRTLDAASFAHNRLEALTLPGGVEHIPAFCFALNRLAAVAVAPQVGTAAGALLPEGIVEVGESAFHGNPIETVDLPASVRVVGRGAFAETRIRRLHVRGPVRIHEHAFRGAQLSGVVRLAAGSMVHEDAFDAEVLVQIAPSPPGAPAVEFPLGRLYPRGHGRWRRGLATGAAPAHALVTGLVAARARDLPTPGSASPRSPGRAAVGLRGP